VGERGVGYFFVGFFWGGGVGGVGVGGEIAKIIRIAWRWSGVPLGFWGWGPNVGCVECGRIR